MGSSAKDSASLIVYGAYRRVLPLIDAFAACRAHSTGIGGPLRITLGASEAAERAQTLGLPGLERPVAVRPTYGG